MKVVKSALVAVYYLFLQVIVSVGLIFWKINTDPVWCDKLLASTGFSDNVALVMDLVLPAVIISDLIIVIPLLFKSKFSMFKKVELKAGIDFLAIGLACNYVISYVVTCLENLPIAQSYNELIDFTLNGDPIFMILSAGILAPLVEELCFRYWVFDICKEKSDTYKIIISALISLASLFLSCPFSRSFSSCRSATSRAVICGLSLLASITKRSL